MSCLTYDFVRYLYSLDFRSKFRQNWFSKRNFDQNRKTAHEVPNEARRTERTPWHARVS